MISAFIFSAAESSDVEMIAKHSAKIERLKENVGFIRAMILTSMEAGKEIVRSLYRLEIQKRQMIIIRL